MKKLSFIRTLAALLIFAMLIPVAVACTPDKEPDQSSTTTAVEAKYPTADDYTGETITLASNTVKPVIYVDNEDFKQTVRAVGDLQTDFEAVTSVKPEIVNNADGLSNAAVAVIIGTLGHSELIDELVKSNSIDTTGVAGEWEAYRISVVKNPLPGVESAVIIAGSDKRGTIYGTYELSEQIGVSPWYWWGDVEIEKVEKVELPLSVLEQVEKPDVKYRGIFINDEENLTNWSAKFISKDNQGRPNPEVYKHVFELLLRLKANTLWPAMHACSDAFNEYKNPKTGISYNAEYADDYGIVMSASHCEMMLRDNEGEWQDWAIANEKKYNIKKVNDSWRSSYDYTVNAEAMNAYWEERVAENYLFENIYMIGLRGVHDSGINCSALSNASYANKAAVVKKAVEAQLKILEKYEALYEEKTGEAITFQTCYCVYKEAAEYYKYDIGLPKSCYLMYCEDNNGYVRTTPTDEELATYAGVGMYYHISYWGRPNSYLWINNTTLPLIAEEMRKCYYSKADDFWILNVGDIKPGEMKTEYFLDLAWDIESHTENNTEEYSAEFLKQNFKLNDSTATHLAVTLTDFYQIMRNYMPEQMGKDNMEYSVVNYGGEGLIVLEKLQAIYEESLAVYNSLPAAKKDSYYEMLHYTIYSVLLMNRKYVYEALNQTCINQGRFAAANVYADLSIEAYNGVLREVDYFNSTVANGKWNKIINPYNSAQPTIDGAPNVTKASVVETKNGATAAIEGYEVLQANSSLTFGSLNDDIRFIDIFSKNDKQAAWALSLPTWIILKDESGTVLTGTTTGGYTLYTGTVIVEDRYYMSVDWSAFTSGETKQGKLTINDDYSENSSATLNAVKAAVDPTKETKKGYYEENGVVSIEAEHFSSNVPQSGYAWTYIDGIGRSGGCMKVTSTGEYDQKKITINFDTTSPYLEYNIYFNTTGTYSGIFYRLPTLNESTNGRSTCRSGFSFDGSAVKSLSGTTTADDSDTSPWAVMIKKQIESIAFSVTVESTGWHTLRIYMVDSEQLFDQIILNIASPLDSRLGAPETFNTVSWTHPATSKLPAIDADDITWGEYNCTKYFDFSLSTGNTQSGYTKVSTSDLGSKNAGWLLESEGTMTGYQRSNTKLAALDNGFVGGSKKTTFSLWGIPNTKYSITLGIGDPSGTVKTSGMNVTCNGVPMLTNLTLSKAGVYGYGIVCTSDADGLVCFTITGGWTLNYLEMYLFTDTAASGTGSFTSDKNGNIMIEAEAATENSQYASITAATDGTNKTWNEVGSSNGTAMFFGQNVGGSNSTASMDSKTAKLNYTINFKISGNYTVWAYLKSSGSDDDSLIIALDGGQIQTTNDFGNTNGFVWKQIGTVSVSAKGEMQLTIFGREDGLTIDRILLHSQNSGDTGFTASPVRN